MADIRPYQPSDRDAIYEICLGTGRSGEDATGWLENDDVLPDIYALPYVDLSPETAFVVDVDGRLAQADPARTRLAAAVDLDLAGQVRAHGVPLS